MSKPRRAPLGTRNIVGAKITRLRKEKQMKQKELAAKLQSMGMDISESSLYLLDSKYILYKLHYKSYYAKILFINARCIFLKIDFKIKKLRANVQITINFSK